MPSRDGKKYNTWATDAVTAAQLVRLLWISHYFSVT
ncbi:MAG: hypothetical protein RIT04_58, partial [Candidatus Parcubacteria bacterium]